MSDDANTPSLLTAIIAERARDKRVLCSIPVYHASGVVLLIDSYKPTNMSQALAGKNRRPFEQELEQEFVRAGVENERIARRWQWSGCTTFIVSLTGHGEIR